MNDLQPSFDTDISRLEDTQLLDRLGVDLRTAGYRAETLDAWFADDVATALKSGSRVAAAQVQAHKRETEPHRLALVTLIDVFVVGLTRDADALAHAFPTLTLAGARALGLITEVSDGSYRAGLSLTAFGPWLVLSDLDDHLRGTSASRDHVMGVGGATKSLIEAIPHDAIGSALEIGTGCGIVALELAQIAQNVVATDVSKRALTFASANLRLNEVTNVQLRRGDMFSPVQTEVFDLIVSNPPFVISPAGAEEHYVYRTSGEPGDALLRRLLSEAPGCLGESGTLVCLANWETAWGSEADETARSLVADAGLTCAAWIVGRGRQTPLEYAGLWLRDGGMRPSDPQYEHDLGLWIEDLQRRRVAHVEFGYVMIRHAPTCPELRIESVPGTLGQTERFGDTWSRTFTHWLDAMRRTDDEFQELTYRLRSGVEEIRTMIPGTEDITSISYVQRSGIERFESVDTFSAAVLGACDGDLTVQQIADALAQLLDIAPEQARAETCSIVREHVARGLLEPHTVD